MGVVSVTGSIPGPKSKEILSRKERVVCDPLDIHVPAVIDHARGATFTDNSFPSGLEQWDLANGRIPLISWQGTDLDSILYTLAGLSDDERGWGRAGETWNALAAAAPVATPATLDLRKSRRDKPPLSPVC